MSTFIEPNSPPSIDYRFFQRFTEKQFAKIQQKLEQESYKDEKKPILCKACQHKITSYENKIEVNGQNQHAFSNPGGFIYEIGCFSQATGCVNQGSPTLEYTWFKGYYWRFALCSNCYIHLGWFYQSANDSFYGLILNCLDEGV
jgi:hypothetical protein